MNADDEQNGPKAPQESEGLCKETRPLTQNVKNVMMMMMMMMMI